MVVPINKKLLQASDNRSASLVIQTGYDTTGEILNTPTDDDVIVQSAISKFSSTRTEYVVDPEDATSYIPQKTWNVNYRQQFFRASIWLIAISLAVYSHFDLVRLLGPTDTNESYWVQFAKAAEPHRTVLNIYSAVIAGFTLIAAIIVATIVLNHYKEPRFRMLLPPFLFHLCLLDLLFPFMGLLRHLYGIYYLELHMGQVMKIIALTCESIVVTCMLYALLARIRVMYAVYVRGEYDVEYHWTVIRIAIQYAVFHLFCLFYLGPPKFYWLSYMGIRLGVFCIVLETCYYMVRLRNTRYEAENYAQLLYIWGYGCFTFIVLTVVLPAIHPVARSTDQFMATFITLWAMNVEVLGPALWYTFRTSMKWESVVADKPVCTTARDRLREVLADPILYPIILYCAQKQFCEENIEFLHDGYSLLTAVTSLELKSATSVCYVNRRTQEFIEAYVMTGATSLVNLSSAHITKFKQVYTAICAAGDGVNLEELKFELVLAQSLSEVSDLITSSGVLTMYEKSAERKSVYSERAALKRLELRE